MSVASATRTVKFITKAGTYTAVIMCPDGDVYQEYTGTQTEFTVSPNFEKTKPKLNFVCVSSRVAEGASTPESINFYFNDTKIEFNGDTSTGIYAGYFKKIAPTGDNPYYALQIVKNIVDLAGFANAVIKMVAVISYGTQSDTIQASYTIPINQSTGTAYRVTIAAGDTKSFVITEKGGSCILKALAYQAGSLITKDLTYIWEKMGTSGWVAVEGEAAQTLTVSSDDIDTYGEYRVRVLRSGVEIGSDIQGVMDASDPYDIDPNPSPADEAITEDENGNGEVVYTPKVVKRGTSVVALPDAKFFFVIKDAGGVYLNSESERTTASATGKVTRAQCLQAGGDVSITMTATA